MYMHGLALSPAVQARMKLLNTAVYVLPEIYLKESVIPELGVTSNLKDFDAEALKALGVQVQSPDDFLTVLATSKPEVMEAATREAAANLTKTNPTWGHYLTLLETGCGLPKYVACLRSGLGDEPSTAPQKAT